ncbi:MAG: polyprenyl synthetase family protein [Balneolaceae bacterium]
MKFLEQYARRIDEALDALPLPDQPETLYAPQRYLLDGGGKRFRPVLTLLSCGLCSGKTEDALPAAVAVELLHNFTLMHDDIMDQADQRRGRASVHVKWSVATAILSGDSMFTQALLQLQKLPDHLHHKSISNTFLTGINRVCEGQALDMEFETRTDVTTHDYLHMIAGKTGALIACALQMGGQCAVADEATVERLGELGHKLGLAFQIQDDLLDVVADPGKFGKKTAGDIVEGKKTYLMLLALERCSDSDAETIRTLLANTPLTTAQVQQIIGIYRSCNVLDETAVKINELYTEACELLEPFDDSPYKSDLTHVIETLKIREY